MPEQSSVHAITPLLIRKIEDHFSKVQREQVEPWIFFGVAPLKIERCRNRGFINYSGVGFSGSPRDVFWGGFVEPCLEDAILASIKEVSETLIVDKNDTELILTEAAEIMKGWIRKIYLKMSDIDQRLRGKGFPNSVGRVDCSEKIAAMQKKVDEYVMAHKHLLKPKAKNKMKSIKLWVGVLAGIATIAVAINTIFFKRDKPTFKTEQSSPVNSPVLNMGDGSVASINYGNQEPLAEGMRRSEQALTSPVGTKITVGAMSQDAVAITGMSQQGKKTILELEPISDTNSWLLDILTIKNAINDAKAWKVKRVSSQYEEFKKISSDFASRNMAGGGGFINALIKSVNSFTEEGEIYITELSRKIEQIMVKHNKKFSEARDISDYHKEYLKLIEEIRLSLKPMQEVPLTRCVQAGDEQRCAEIVRPEKFRKFEPELLQ